MFNTMFVRIFFAIFLIKFVTSAKLNLEEELKYSVELSTLYRSIKFAAPSPNNGVRVVQKCCPFGQMYLNINGSTICGRPNNTSDFDEAEPYQTDNHFAFELQPLKRKLCGSEHEMVIGLEDDEKLYISRQGFLLTTDQIPPGVVLHKRFCVERDADLIIALVCESDELPLPPESVFTNRIIPICMIISVPLLFGTAMIYLLVPKLRNVHGETLALYAVCLGLGYLLMAYNKFASINDFRGIHSGIHFFMLSSFCWLLMMTVDMGYHVWSYYPSPMHFQRSILLRLTIYSFIAFGVPALIVATIHSNQTLTQRAVNLLAPIMIPISIILFLNFLMFIPIYKYYTKNTPCCIIKVEVRYRAKSVAWILTIIAANWMFEMVSLMWEHLRLSLIAFPTLDALQGVVLVCVFVLMPHYKRIIKEWWDEKKYCEPEEQVEQHMNGFS